MTIEEIRKNAPPKATGYYEADNQFWYCYVNRGRVYKLVKYMEFNEGWLKYFKPEIKPL